MGRSHTAMTFGSSGVFSCQSAKATQRHVASPVRSGNQCARASP
jgi:hypothetical protein